MPSMRGGSESIPRGLQRGVAWKLQDLILIPGFWPGAGNNIYFGGLKINVYTYNI
jgi:hypothetical protein